MLRHIHACLVGLLGLAAAAAAQDVKTKLPDGKPAPGKDAAHWIKILEKEGDPLAQEEALEVLGKLGPAARTALPALKKIADDPNASLRKKAVMTIFRIDPRADVSPAILLDGLKDASAQEKLQCAMLLARAAANSPTLTKQVLDAFPDLDPGTRALLVERLTGLSPAVYPVLEQAFEHKHPQVRAAALAVAGRMTGEAAKSLPAVRGLLKDPDLAVRFEAARIVWQLDAKNDKKQLAGIFKEAAQNPEVRARLFGFLRVAQPPLRDAALFEVALQHGSAEVRLQAIEGLADLGKPSKELFTPLLDLVRTDVGQRAKALRLVRKIEEGFGVYRGHLALSSHGRWLAVVCGRVQTEVVVWDVRTGQAHKTLLWMYSASSPLFAPDERFLGQLGGPSLYLYDFLADESKSLHVADGFREIIRSAAFSADSRLAAVAVESEIALAGLASPFDTTAPRGRLFCVELTTQQIRYDFPQFKSSVEALAMSPDGRHLAVAAEPDHIVHMLDMHTGAEVCRFAGHRGRVLRVAFSPQGHRLASASADTTALVWDLAFLAQDKTPKDNLAAGELETLWQALTLPGGPKVHEAIMRLSRHPGEAVPYFKTRFKPLKEADPKQLVRWIQELDDDEFFIREHAMASLAKWIDAAAPLLRDVVAKSRSAEAIGRARLILADHKPRPENAWREFRAVEVLEKMAVPVARALLRSLADEAPTSARAREAQAALKRLGA